jgi:mannosylglucosylglycerate synthase
MRAAVVSFRLGAADGVSVEAAKWAAAMRRLGWRVRTVAGAGRANVLIPGLDLDSPDPPDLSSLDRALAKADVVLVENVLSLPRNLPAAEALATLLSGRPAVLHHHDLPWQRAGQFSVRQWPPDDPVWRHVTINELTRAQLAERGIDAVAIYNTVAVDRPLGRRRLGRRRLGVDRDALLVLQPTRAIERKNVPAGIAVAEQLGASYWLTGPAEDGYAETLARQLDRAGCPVLRRLPAGLTMADAYAAADVVAFPSTWEGFGNPVLEAAVYRRPLVVADYPVLGELRRFGFHWFSVGELDALREFLRAPDEALHEHNADLARRFFAPETLDARLEALLSDAVAGARTATAAHAAHSAQPSSLA